MNYTSDGGEYIAQNISLENFSKKFNKNFIISIVSLILLNSYFLYHLFAGINSFNSVQKIINEKDQKIIVLKNIKKINSTYQKKIDMLTAATPDLDYLDEIARLELNYSNKDEKVIILTENYGK